MSAKKELKKSDKSTKKSMKKYAKDKEAIGKAVNSKPVKNKFPEGTRVKPENKSSVKVVDPKPKVNPKKLEEARRDRIMGGPQWHSNAPSNHHTIPHETLPPGHKLPPHPKKKPRPKKETD